MSEFTQEQLDAAVNEAVAKAISEANKNQLSQNDIDNAVEAAKSEINQNNEAKTQAAIKLAVDQEKSKREDIEKRLKAAKKSQIPSALEGLDDSSIDGLIQAAQYTKGLSEDKRLLFFEHVASGNIQQTLVSQRAKWDNEILAPKDLRIVELETELSQQKKLATYARKSGPLRDAILAHCNPDKYAQQDAFRRIDAMFEDQLTDEGGLKPKQSGDHLGICPQTNAPFTPETAAKYLAREISYLAKPSTTTDVGGQGNKPNQGGENLTLQERLNAAKTKEERKAIFSESRKKAS